MKIGHFFSLILCIFASQSTLAATVAIDFATLPQGDNQHYADFGNGFEMQALGHYDVYGDKILVHGNCCGFYGVQFTYNQGETFDLLEVYDGSGYWFEVRGSNGLTAVFKGNQTGIHTFGDQWKNLTWVAFGSRDNTYIKDPVFAVSSVPLPAPILLFSSALMGLLVSIRVKR